MSLTPTHLPVRVFRRAESARRSDPCDPRHPEHAVDPVAAAARQRRRAAADVHHREARGEPQLLGAGGHVLARRDGLLRDEPRREPDVLPARARRERLRLQRAAGTRTANHSKENFW